MAQKDRGSMTDRLAAIFRDTLRRMADERIGAADVRSEIPFLSSMTAFALAQRPDDPFLNGLMGEILFDEEDYEAALPYILKAPLRGAGGENHRARLAETLYRLERYEEALPHLKAVARRYPGDETMQMMAAYASFRGDDFAAARRFLSRVDMTEIDMGSFRIEIAAMLGAGMQRLATPRP